MISTFYWVLLQICIANPNQDVLLTLTKAGIVELIGKEWYFVRVHDAVQVCLQHVQSLNQTPKNPDSFAEDKPSFFQRLSKQREEDLSIAELESGDKITEPHLEPLLSRKSWILLDYFYELMMLICRGRAYIDYLDVNNWLQGSIICKFLGFSIVRYVCLLENNFFLNEF